MKQSIKTSSQEEKVIVNVLVNNDRKKKFPKASDPEPSIYLNDQEEFSLEFMSTFKEIIGITIEMNGILLSNRKIILKPGQRVVLDRHIEKPKTFKFAEYSLGKKGDELTEIAKEVYESSKMGLIVVNVHSLIKMNNKINEPYYISPSIFDPIDHNYYNCTNTVSTSSTFDDLINSSLYGSNLRSNITLDFLSAQKSSTGYTSKLSKKELEEEKGGIISEGKKSNSTFDIENFYFTDYKIKSYKLRLEPAYREPVEPEKTKNKKYFCTNCGSVIQSTYNFCGNCGNKL